MHEPHPVTVNDRGEEAHPAFGAIRASRISSTPGAVLFDSEIAHTNVVRIRIGHMTRKRDLNRDWLHDTGPALVEVDLSDAQWAAFVSSMNTTAVPCTIRSTETTRDVPGLEFAPRLAESARETREAADRAFATIKEALAALESLDPKAGAKARREAMANLHHAVENAPGNVEFAAQSLTRHTEAVVTKARADIEAMAVTRAAQLGLTPTEAMQAIGMAPAAPAQET